MAVTHVGPRLTMNSSVDGSDASSPRRSAMNFKVEGSDAC